MSACLSTWLSSRTPQGNQCEILLFLASVGDCNLILHFHHVVINWQLSKQGICWPVLQNRSMGLGVDPLRLGVSFFYYPLTSYILQTFNWSQAQAQVLSLSFSFLLVFSLFLFLFSVSDISSGKLKFILDILWLIILHFEIHSASKYMFYSATSIQGIPSWPRQVPPDMKVGLGFF